jgi:hypothetical protein
MGSRGRGGAAAPPPPLAPRQRRPLLRRGLGAREDEENAGGAGPRLVIWSGANSVAWGARFLGPDGGGNATSSVANSSSQSSGQQQQQQPQEQGQGGGAARAADGGESSSLFIGVIVALVVCFYLLCTYQCLRLWLCSKLLGREAGGDGGPGGGADGGSANTVLVHEGRVFNLSGDQRRQVLEVIFSESSKVRAAAAVPFDCRRAFESLDQRCFFFSHIAHPLTR